MKLSKRALSVEDSITLKLNEVANRLSEEGHHIYNLTGGQLPFKPMPEFIEKIENQLNFLKSFQYSPVPGFSALRTKLMDYVQKKRNIDFKEVEQNLEIDIDCVINNGSKHTLYNIFGSIIDPGDEVVLLAPYWVSYPPMIEFWGGKISVVDSQQFDAYIPDIDSIKKAITSKTKAIIVNSPNNPSGVHYSQEWMEEFGQLMKDYPDLIIISDEVYSELAYFDPKPTYFYQYDQTLFSRTVIVDGISKSLACTGLRVGYCIASSELTNSIRKIQGQTTSGPSSLIQRALVDFDFDEIEKFIDPIQTHLRKLAEILRETYRKYDLAKNWYQSMSAFYYVVDFSRTPVFESYGDTSVDHSQKICEDIFDQLGIALVPISDFGIQNAARLSLVLGESAFTEACERLVSFLAMKDL
jgi:aspartate aminotransferase